MKLNVEFKGNSKGRLKESEQATQRALVGNCKERNFRGYLRKKREQKLPRNYKGNLKVWYKRKCEEVQLGNLNGNAMGKSPNQARENRVECSTQRRL